ncbi:MAG: AAA family ATPase [Erysipelotrichia bacterium]|nr:AAA family ATPase [Erysipelotrichia bacterium]
MEHIFQNKFQIFKDGILELSDEDNFRIDPDFKLSMKTHRAIFGSTLKSKQRFEAYLTKHISYKTCKQTLFLDEPIANITHTLSTAISKEHYKRIVKELKDAQLPSGLVTLLYGYPGTGKTATVYEISKLTKRDILQVDIASIRDKYVGESEKKLKGIFKEYARAKEELKHIPILLFNEADALFGQRMDTSDSVDVMNNSMQNILLEELEKFEGIFFATTNLINNMDNAFNRRFLYKVEFTKPSQQTRAKIWQSKLPQLDDKTYNAIAKYDLTGGQIENVTRKYMVDKILNLKAFNLDELKQLCLNELQFKQENKQVVGFC